MQLIGPFSALIVGMAMAAATPASADCECIYDGGTVKEGASMCLKTAKGFRVAKCGKVLNNTSWAITEEACAPDMDSSSRSDPTPIERTRHVLAGLRAD
jgi:hypothetical protein